jgi:hypothetical protein
VKSPLAVILGILLVLMGLVWTLQGLGYLAGSPMSGVALWAVVGPLLGLVGVVLAVRGLRRDAHR